MELEEHESIEIRGSSGWYHIKRLGGVYSCSCPAWLHQGLPVELRSCKHLVAVFGEEHEKKRTGGVPARAVKAKSNPEGKAPPLLLAHPWDGEQDLVGWWMSEKLDGVRAYWDGEAFISRLGNAYLAPPWFVDQLPKTKLDGELWSGRKKFQRTISIVRRQDQSRDWEEVRFLVFDAPEEPGNFEARIDFIEGTLSNGRSKYAQAHPHARCEGLDHLRTELKRVESLGGEGLMMRRPGSRYEVGRSSSLLKVKSFHDAEAKVIEHLPGTGKHKGRLGALLVEMPNGTQFSVGTGFSDAERERPPKLGSIITYRYQELSDGGVPRFPSYVAERHDFDWAEAVRAVNR
ncbi:MAG: DNA ligase [Myxococcota bacterium]